MKKNVMMRVASALLVAVLLSTCAISGTFAKYVTAKEATDTARVAKWGVAIDVTNYSVFTNKYTKDDKTATFTGDYSVESKAGDDVLAPGTKGTFAGIKITGTPEVAVEVAVKAKSVDVSSNWIVEDKFYCPITITVGTTTVCGLNYTTEADFEGAIADALAAQTAQYAPNTDLSKLSSPLNISWAWAFQNATGTAINQTDAYDTALGNKAAAAKNAGENLTISIVAEISVTQID